MGDKIGRASCSGPIRSRVLIHNKPSNCASWAFRARNGFYVVPALQRYRCFQVVDTTTKSTLISDTVKFRHDYLAQPTSTHADRLIRALHFLSSALKETPSAAIDAQLDATRQLRDLFQNCTQTTNPQDPPPTPSHSSSTSKGAPLSISKGGASAAHQPTSSTATLCSTQHHLSIPWTANPAPDIPHSHTQGAPTSKGASAFLTTPIPYRNPPPVSP